MNENNIPVASSGLQEGAELYRRRGASEIDYENPAATQQQRAVKSMTAGADLYNRRHAPAAE
ncbi:hypothetical protein [Mycobacteroides abscessus]|uniref:hypothetical protein n=1 Tax=Mycobacteroides abscessus TaxID=36809 RepID=UPI00092C238F|nr:hypothetical protein [Mycobacteroides abscessus]SIJ65711.1 Uncharacterised protein [Mycobacteroides abscessus subsp. abscessus]SLG30546.1 Uncharacterised protein [Mycobacteroides abscessus subsp. abscessus]